jgi:thiol-disulfide isomerase/thioredoxin
MIEYKNSRLMKRTWFSLSNISNALFIVFFLAMIFVPEVKAWTIQKLMKVGLFQPDVPEIPVNRNTVSKPAQFPIVFKDAGGRIVDLATQKDKVIFINFWATWCPPCIAEMPAIQELYNQFKDEKNVLFIMADMDHDFAKAQAFMIKKGFDLPVYASVSKIPEEIYTGTLPTTVILDKSGNVSFHHEGTADYSNPEVAAFIRKLTSGNPL